MYSGNHRPRAHDPDGFEKSEIRGLREGKKFTSLGGGRTSVYNALETGRSPVSTTNIILRSSRSNGVAHAPRPMSYHVNSSWTLFGSDEMLVNVSEFVHF